MRNCNREYDGAACSFCRKQHNHWKKSDMAWIAVGRVRHILHTECYARLQKYMTIDSIKPEKKILLDGLEQKFTTADALKVGEEMGLSERSVMYTLTDLQTMNVVRKIKRGEYEKLQ